jgi:hypothetical protein
MMTLLGRACCDPLVVIERRRIVEEGHQPVAGEMLDRATRRRDRLADHTAIGPQDSEDLLRLGTLGKGGEASQVGE